MRAIITADLHLHNWVVPSYEARRDQYLRLAEWLTKLAYEKGASELYIAGDVFHTSTPSPKTISLAKDFFSILDDKLNAVYVTHGQHDLHIRSGGEVVENSILNALNKAGIPFVYLHREWGGEGRVYFYGWEPDYRLPEESNEAEIIITHATITGSRLETGWVIKDGHAIPPEGPPVFAGDIHRYQRIGRIYIPGPPIQHTHGDSPDVGVLIYDFETGEVERVRTGYLGGKRVYSFYAFVSDKDKALDLDESYLIIAEKKKPSQVEVKKLGLDPLEVVSELARKKGIKRLHNKIVSSVKRSELAPIRLDIRLKRLILNNFTVHKKLDLDLESYPPMNLIVGPNGSGKSSIFQAIKYALVGGSGTSLRSMGEKEMEVVLEFSSGGNDYRIRRGHDKKGYLEVFVNDSPVEAPTISEKEAVLKSHVPAIADLDLWYWGQEAIGPLSSRTQKERFALIARVLGLDIIKALHDKAQEIRSSISVKLASLRETVSSLEAIGEIPDVGPLREELSGKERALREVVSELDKLDDMTGEYVPLVRERDRLEFRISQVKKELASLSQELLSLSSKRCPVCGAPLSDDKHTNMRLEVKTSISEKQAELARLTKDLEAINEKLSELEAKKNEIEPKRAELEEKRSRLMEEVYELRARIREAERLEKLAAELEEKRKERDKLEKELSAVDDYIEIVSPKGAAMASVLEEAGDLLSNGFVRVKAVKKLKSGDIRPHFSLEMNVGDKWIEFDYLSGGQKSLAEVVFFSRLASLIGGVEDLLLDESFRYLDENSVAKAVQALTDGGVRRLWLVSHHEVVPTIDSVIRMG